MFDYINYDGEIIIIGYKGSATEVIIPSEIEGKPVTSIGCAAFQYCNSLTNVTIPDSVKSIGTCAFWCCSSLKSVTIPDSVTSIGDGTFFRCNLKSVTIPESVTSIGDYAFCDCNSLKDVWFSGTEEQWQQIKIGRYSRALHKARKHFKNA